MTLTPMTQAEYDANLDEEIKAFIAETNSWYPTDTYEKSIEEQRAIYDAMCRAFFHGYPEGVSAQDRKAGAVPVRHYQRVDALGAATVLYAHGGGNVVGGLESHDDVCADLCHVTGLDVVAVDYRLAPEFTRTDSLEDCLAALTWVRETLGGPIILAGDSAGGFLTTSVMLKERGASDIVGLVSIYGGFGGYRGTDSMVRHANAPLLTADEALSYEAHLGSVDTAPSDAVDLTGLPPIYAAVAECDPIGGQAVTFVDRVKVAGGSAVSHIDLGLVHGHLRARHRSQKAGASFARVCTAISQLASGEFPAGELRD